MISARQAYERGRAPTFRFDSAALRALLSREGLHRVDLDLCAPRVPVDIVVERGIGSRAGECVFFRIRPGDPDPSIVFKMHPQPWRWWAETGLLVLSASALFVGFRLRSRKRAVGLRRAGVIALAVAAAVAAGVCVFTGAAVAADNLAVAGLLSGWPYAVAQWMFLLALPAGVAALALFCLAFSRQTTRTLGIDSPRTPTAA